MAPPRRSGVERELLLVWEVCEVSANVQVGYGGSAGQRWLRRKRNFVKAGRDNADRAITAREECDLAVGVDMGGTRIKVGLVDTAGGVVARRDIDAQPEQPFETQLSVVAEQVDTLLGELGAERKDVKGLALGFPGIVDRTTRRVLAASDRKYSDAQGWDLFAWSRDELGLALAVENDARMALIGEWRFGAGRDVSNLVMATFGTGLGSAAVIDGRIQRGAWGRAGILGGHVAVPHAGEPCYCGNFGCAEAEASTTYLDRLVTSLPECAGSTLGTASIDYAAVAESATSGDPCGVSLMAHSIKTWTAFVVNLVNAYDPQRVILGGGIVTHETGMFDTLAGSVVSALATITWTPTQAIEFSQAELGDGAALAAAHPLLDEARSSAVGSP